MDFWVFPFVEWRSVRDYTVIWMLKRRGKERNMNGGAERGLKERELLV